MVQLHIHNSVGSRLDGVATCEQYAERAYEFGHKALACTDHGKLSAFWEHEQACKKFNIKSIFGIEAYITENLITTEIKAGKEKRVRGKNYHILILVKNEIGYKNLLKLNYISMADTDHFYYVNRITPEELIEHKEGLIVTTGCMGSLFNKIYLDGDIEKANKYFDRFFQEFGEDFYGEIQLNEFSKLNSEIGEQQIVNDFIIKKCNENGIPIYIGGDVHYLEKGEDWVQTLSIAIRNKDTIDNLTFELESKNLYYHDVKDYIEFNEKFQYGYEKSKIIEWANISDTIADKCNYKLPERNKIYLPKVSEDDESLIIKKSLNGLISYFNTQSIEKVPKIYRDRLKKELEIIIRKGFSSYILILEDIFQFAEKNGYYRGPARGCFLGNSLVKMGNGNKKQIKNIQTGDIVIAGSGKLRKVINRFEYDIDEEIIEIELENNKIIECTLDHKILCFRNGKKEWVEAQSLAENDVIITIHDREFKRCPICKEEKNIGEYFKGNNIDGFSYCCKDCENKYNKEKQFKKKYNSSKRGKERQFGTKNIENLIRKR